jgi:uncharacterized protein YfkK (UPF0435 family)
MNNKSLHRLKYSGRETSRDAAGFMPRGSQFGYIFTKDFSSDKEILQAIAHELGHGRLLLKHTFDKDYKLPQSGTDNLMDYTPLATHLAKWQWDLASDPGIAQGVFDKDEDGMMAAGTGDFIVPQDFLVNKGEINPNAKIIQYRSYTLLKSTTTFDNFMTKIISGQFLNTIVCKDNASVNASISLMVLISKDVYQYKKNMTVIDVKPVEDISEAELKNASLCLYISYRPSNANYKDYDQSLAHEFFIHGLYKMEEINRLDLNQPFESIKQKLIMINNHAYYNTESYDRGDRDHYSFIIGKKKEMTDYIKERLNQINNDKDKTLYLMKYIQQLVEYANMEYISSRNGGRIVILNQIENYLKKDFDQFSDIIFQPISENDYYDIYNNYITDKNKSIWQNISKK